MAIDRWRPLGATPDRHSFRDNQSEVNRPFDKILAFRWPPEPAQAAQCACEPSTTMTPPYCNTHCDGRSVGDDPSGATPNVGEDWS